MDTLKIIDDYGKLSLKEKIQFEDNMNRIFGVEKCLRESERKLLMYEIVGDLMKIEYNDEYEDEDEDEYEDEEGKK